MLNWWWFIPLYYLALIAKNQHAWNHLGVQDIYLNIIWEIIWD
jgi:hypothetical protein